jgi:hypothetical protein
MEQYLRLPIFSLVPQDKQRLCVWAYERISFLVGFVFISQALTTECGIFVCSIHFNILKVKVQPDWIAFLSKKYARHVQGASILACR